MHLHRDATSDFRGEAFEQREHTLSLFQCFCLRESGRLIRVLFVRGVQPETVAALGAHYVNHAVSMYVNVALYKFI